VATELVEFITSAGSAGFVPGGPRPILLGRELDVQPQSAESMLKKSRDALTKAREALKSPPPENQPGDQKP